MGDPWSLVHYPVCMLDLQIKISHGKSLVINRSIFEPSKITS